ncbi:MAG: ABC transporter permease [Thermomicrobiales bacterium]|nr:ABC transporter permease [Thermomicrobiales bacterium]MCO5223109.1 ABC transporter permease [Thermomicrobiales bacterium]
MSSIDSDLQRTIQLGEQLDPATQPLPPKRRFDTFRKLMVQKASLVGFVICAVFIVLAIFAPIIAPYDPIKIDPVVILQPPSSQHWLGTDELGRDVLSRLIFGARVSLLVSIVAVSIALVVGVVVGMVSGYFGGKVESIAMRCMDAFSAFPAILLALAILSVLGPGIRNAMIAIGVVYIPAFARIMRGSVLGVKQTEYVQAARAAGAGDLYIMRRSIFPNCVSPLIVHASLAFASAIIVEAALSFLGLGTQPPTPSWGAMLNEGRQFAIQNVWYSISAGVAIFLAVLGLNLLGDGLRDVLDPRFRSA